MYFYVVLCIVCFVSFSVLFVCIYVLNYCHRVATQFQLNISYHILSYHIIAYHISYHIESNQLTVQRAMIAVCSEIRTKHVNTLCAQNLEFFNIEADSTRSNQWDLESF